jgi:ornithine decarboxylase
MFFCRIPPSGTGSDWSLSEKFGCCPELVYDVLLHANECGMVRCGSSLYVGSQQNRTGVWNEPIALTEKFSFKKKHDISLDLINIGGGFPAQYCGNTTTTLNIYGKIFEQALLEHWETLDGLMIIFEPGPALFAATGVILSLSMQSF